MFYNQQNFTFVLYLDKMKTKDTGCFIYSVLILFSIISFIYIAIRKDNCVFSDEYPCSVTSSDLFCAECNDGSIEDLSSFWSQLFVSACEKKGGVKQYKCKKCL